MMKLAILTLSVLSVAVGRPSASLYSPFVRFAQDGAGYSYSYQTPSAQNYVQTVVRPAQVYRSAYVQSVPVAEPHSFVVGPQVSYTFGNAAQAHLRRVQPSANIQLSSDGFVLDTEEVAQARAEHLAAVARESLRAGSSASSSDAEYEDTVEVGAPVVKTFAPANIQLSADGHVIDTAEVAQARAEHLARFAAEAAKASSGSVATFGFTQPINIIAHNQGQYTKSYENANIQVGADGHVIDTAEVSQARAEHLARLAAETAQASSGSVATFGLSQPINAAVYSPVQYTKSYENANIQVGADGHVIDTAEVSQARAEHLARLAAETSQAGSGSVATFGLSQPFNAVVYNPVQYTKSYENANIQVGADGHVIDTAEVSQARAEHLARVAAETAQATFGISQPINAAVYSPVQYTKSYENANIQVGADGHVIDTAEVSQARAEHLARVAAETAKASSGSISTYGFAQNPIQYVKSNEIAHVRLSADGHVLDTPEVEQAKAAHFARYASEAARAAAAGEDSQDYSDSSSTDAESVSVGAYNVNNVFKSEDAPADIKLSADGFVLDTAEVAQAKAEHLAKLAAAGPYDEASDDSENSVVVNSGSPSYITYTSPSVAYTSAPYGYAQARWTGPEANIQVGADGFLVDTPEVQQARSEHLANRNAALAGSSGSSSWSGASSRYASTQQTPGGEYLLDTPEVSAARAAHLFAHAKESARVSSSSGSQTQTYGQLVYNAPAVRTSQQHFGYSFGVPAYNLLSFRYAPTASPVALTSDGQFLLDTPEVAAAKASHFAAHARARGY